MVDSLLAVPDGNFPLTYKEQDLVSLLDSDVLKLNANWAPIGIISVRKSFEDAFAGAVTLLKFHEGYPTPYRIEDWIELPIHNGEDFVTTSRMHGLKKIAVPRVVIAIHFNRIISKEQKLNLGNLARRYKHTCAVTGKKLTPEEFSREHVVPRSKGGKSGWDNEVLMDRKKNSKRGNRDYKQLGLKQPKILGAPPPLLPINAIVNRNNYPEWQMFNIPTES